MFPCHKIPLHECLRAITTLLSIVYPLFINTYLAHLLKNDNKHTISSPASSQDSDFVFVCLFWAKGQEGVEDGDAMDLHVIFVFT